VVLLVNVSVLGLKLQLAPAGRPEHAKVTVPVNPFTCQAVNDIDPEPPGLDMVMTGLESEEAE
jgi:hypothetical protein